MTPGSFLDQYAAAESVERVKRAEKASKELIKQRRRHLQFKKKLQNRKRKLMWRVNRIRLAILAIDPFMSSLLLKQLLHHKILGAYLLLVPTCSDEFRY